MVRLRAYPDGRTRPYLGERFSDSEFVEPFVPHSLDEMCATAPQLELGKTITIRRGGAPFTFGDLLFGGDCGEYFQTSGYTAVYVDVPEAGRYRFAVVKRDPAVSAAGSVAMQLRSECSNPQSFVECTHGIVSVDPIEIVLPDYTVTLEPGRYWLVVGGETIFAGPADITLAAAREDAFDAITIDTAPTPESGVALLLRNDEAATPSREPEPLSTVDRLLLVELTHGQVGTAHVTLRGSCAGSMARLGADGLPDPDSAETCVDSDGVRVPLQKEELAPGLARPTVGETLQGSFAPEEPCEEESSNAEVACVPPGVFLLGHLDFHPTSVGVSHFPERVARMPRFWIDRFEVTVGRWRAAVARGFDPAPLEDPNQRDEPISHATNPKCPWTALKGDFEDSALSCINWYGARAFCRFEGGDLPTEAEWEYVATKVGRSFETAFPWGDQAPSCRCEPGVEDCHAAIEAWFSVVGFEAGVSELVPGECSGGSSGVMVPPPSLQGGAHGDTSAGIGVVGLAGGVAEWTRDSLRPYGTSCWVNASVDQPECWEEEAPLRSWRGGNVTSALKSRMIVRSGAVPAGPTVYAGFRCVYAKQPSQ